MRKQKFIAILFTTIFVSIILSCPINAKALDDMFPSGYELKDNNHLLYGTTMIITPFAEKIRYEVIADWYVPKNTVASAEPFLVFEGDLDGQVDLYINDKKANFDDYYTIEDFGPQFKIVQKNKLDYTENFEIRFIFDVVNSSNVQLTLSNLKMLNGQFQVFFDEYKLYDKYILRVPLANSHNVEMDILNGFFIYPQNYTEYLTPSSFYVTDGYAQIEYLFWNDNLYFKYVSSDIRPILLIYPGVACIVQMTIGVSYETIRYTWLLQALFATSFAIIIFIGGNNYKKREKKY